MEDPLRKKRWFFGMKSITITHLLNASKNKVIRAFPARSNPRNQILWIKWNCRSFRLRFVSQLCQLPMRCTTKERRSDGKNIISSLQNKSMSEQFYLIIQNILYKHNNTFRVTNQCSATFWVSFFESSLLRCTNLHSNLPTVQSTFELVSSFLCAVVPPL